MGPRPCVTFSPFLRSHNPIPHAGPSVLWGGRQWDTVPDVTVERDRVPESRVCRQGGSLTLKRCRGDNGGPPGCYSTPSCYSTCGCYSTGGHLGLACPCSRPASALCMVTKLSAVNLRTAAKCHLPIHCGQRQHHRAISVHSEC